MDKQEKQATFSSLTGFHRAVPIILVAISLFIGFCFITQDIGALGLAIASLLRGLFSYGAYVVPFLILSHALFYPADLQGHRWLSRLIFSLLTLVVISAVCHTFTLTEGGPIFTPGEFFVGGTEGVGGGLVGGVVAYGLIMVFGKIGTIIIALAIVAIYAVYFFAGSKRALGKFLHSILKGILYVFMMIEKGFKALFSIFTKKKDERTNKEAEQRQGALTDDDFFDVDNGLGQLSIPALGISETRSSGTDVPPTLQESVHHRSEVTDSEPTKATTDSTIHIEPRVINLDFEITDEDTVTGSSGEGKKEESSLHSVESKADAVFTEDFDPYKMSMSEELIYKPSTRSLVEEKPTVIEDIVEVSEEELERERRRRAFEQRKAQVTENHPRQKEVPVSNSGEYTGSTKTLEISESESVELSGMPKSSGEASFVIEKTEPVTPVVIEPLVIDISSLQDYTNSTHTTHQATPVPSASDNTSTASDEGVTFNFVTRNGEEDSGRVWRSHLEESEENDDSTEGGLGFELDIDTQRESSNSIRIERTTLSGVELDAEDEEEDAYDESTLDEAEDDEPNTEEIPPEKQNPEVIGMRDMFPALRDLGASIKAEEPKKTVHISEPTYTYKDDEDEYADSYDEDGYKEEDDSFAEELPFDGGRVVEPEKPKKETSKKVKPNFTRYKAPPLDLLLKDNTRNDEEIALEIEENTRIIIETLASFNVTASIKCVDRGPRITRYEVVPAKGVKVTQITNLYGDIVMNLAADGIRMEAPIPGKSAIGFEVPNAHPETVRLRELLECEEFQSAKSNTLACIGKDVAGNPVFGDISKFPHALIAGATGMGKSVSINAILISILYKARPDQVKLILIDPKRVEFRVYSGIPHLLIPVVTEAKQAAGALMWAVEEMERRYDLIEKLNLRNISAYNERVAQDPTVGDPLPKIIIVIDELNDLMMQVRDPCEDLIMRIAQKARAAGIHLIIGTQRPDVKVITGTIKANINTRMSCKVTSVQDSRTILDMAGAEKLLDKGDMLYKPVDKPKPIRVQSAYTTDGEVEAVMEYLKSQAVEGQYDEEVLAEINRAAQKCGNKKNGGAGMDEDDDDDDVGLYNDQKFLDAVEVAIRMGKVSTSLLQRKLSIGYSRAAKYLDSMEAIGVVSEPNGQKPRDVLMSMDEWHEKLYRVGSDG